MVEKHPSQDVSNPMKGIIEDENGIGGTDVLAFDMLQVPKTEPLSSGTGTTTLYTPHPGNGTAGSEGVGHQADNDKEAVDDQHDGLSRG